MWLKKFLIVLLELGVVSILVSANSCPKWLPLPMMDGLHAVIPIYDESITGPDMDCDGILDSVDTDIDGDGISNAVENANGTNPLNPDTDGDGVGDNNDAFPLDGTESVDTDGDGVGNNADPDDDNDRHRDVNEIATGTNPLDASSYPTPFIITVKTDNYGTSADNEFTIPTYVGETYSYRVDCDIDSDDLILFLEVTGDYTCSYSSPGIYRIAIYSYADDGTGFPGIDFGNTSGIYENEKILGVNQWGTGHWKTMEGAFYYCINLCDAGGAAVDSPNLSNVTNMAYMFSWAENFNQDIGAWDTSHVENMAFMFRGATSFNQDIGSWDTSKVKNMFSMFNGAVLFNQPLNNWKTGKVQNMNSMFENATAFNQPIGSWNTENVSSMEWMFHNALNFNQAIGGWNTEYVEYMRGMFSGASNFNQNLGTWDTQSVKDMSFMFQYATHFNLPWE